MEKEDLIDDMEELSSAEDFLNYFNIEFDQSVVHVNRLHIMQRYHDYLEKVEPTSLDETEEGDDLFKVYQTLLNQAYMDFVESDALTEKVFKVFKMHEPQTGFVSVEQLLGQ